MQELTPNYYFQTAIYQAHRPDWVDETLKICEPYYQNIKSQGAYKKIFDVAKEFKIDNIVTATKVRDLKTGKILHTEVPTPEMHNDIKYVIVDDICDGGATFLNAAEEIRKYTQASLYLIVSHGIFSAGTKKLLDVFADVYVLDNNYNRNRLNLLKE
jgi:ribose-phosphate pyrophosphokinase